MKFLEILYKNNFSRKVVNILTAMTVFIVAGGLLFEKFSNPKEQVILDNVFKRVLIDDFDGDVNLPISQVSLNEGGRLWVGYPLVIDKGSGGREKIGYDSLRIDFSGIDGRYEDNFNDLFLAYCGFVVGGENDPRLAQLEQEDRREALIEGVMGSGNENPILSSLENVNSNIHADMAIDGRKVVATTARDDEYFQDLFVKIEAKGDERYSIKSTCIGESVPIIEIENREGVKYYKGEQEIRVDNIRTVIWPDLSVRRYSDWYLVLGAKSFSFVPGNHGAEKKMSKNGSVSDWSISGRMHAFEGDSIVGETFKYVQDAQDVDFPLQARTLKINGINSDRIDLGIYDDEVSVKLRSEVEDVRVSNLPLREGFRSRLLYIKDNIWAKMFALIWSLLILVLNVGFAYIKHKLVSVNGSK